jgi:hypothetical protein
MAKYTIVAPAPTAEAGASRKRYTIVAPDKGVATDPATLAPPEEPSMLAEGAKAHSPWRIAHRQGRSWAPSRLLRPSAWRRRSAASLPNRHHGPRADEAGRGHVRPSNGCSGRSAGTSGSSVVRPGSLVIGGRRGRPRDSSHHRFRRRLWWRDSASRGSRCPRWG